MKEKFIKYGMEVAKVTSILSSCQRRKVGAVIMKDSRIISVGYNGTLSGASNNCEDNEGKTKESVLHAEENAILFAAKNGISVNDCSMFVTVLPCERCARMIVQSGIKEVYYSEKYHNGRGLKLLKENKIKVKKI